MKNYVGPGKTKSYTAGADKASGQAVLIGDTLAICTGPIKNGETGEVATEGVFKDIPKLSTDTFVDGQILFWDDGNSRLTEIASTHKPVGICQGVFGNGTTVATIKLHPMTKDTTA